LNIKGCFGFCKNKKIYKKEQKRVKKCGRHPHNKKFKNNLMKIQTIKLSDLIASEYNPRKASKEQEKALSDSLKKFGCVEPVIVNEYEERDKEGNIVVSRKNIIIGGHFRVRELKKLGHKEVDCVIVNLPLEEEKELNIRLNANTGDWDWDIMKENFDIEDLSEWGLDYVYDDTQSGGKYELNAEKRSEVRGNLSKQFLMCPFSVINANKFEWQERKKEWLKLGIDSGQGRDDDIVKGLGILSKNICKNTSLTGTSIFDPVLCEVMYSWFSREDDLIIDPFAGGSVRGIVANELKRKYTGIDLSGRQIEANIENIKAIYEDGADNQNIEYIIGDSNVVLDTIEDNKYNICLSCPPYVDLEKYSDNPNDLSNMDYNSFMSIYGSTIQKTYNKLKDNSFAVWVIGEVRNKQGNYYNFVGDTIKQFINAGFKYYNEIILETALATAQIRAGKQFRSGRKVVKVHQNVLVFCKGDGKKATERLGDVKIKEIEIDNEEIGEDSDEEV
jgi:DNA modification methylase